MSGHRILIGLAVAVLLGLGGWQWVRQNGPVHDALPKVIIEQKGTVYVAEDYPNAAIKSEPDKHEYEAGADLFTREGFLSLGREDTAAAKPNLRVYDDEGGERVRIQQTDDHGRVIAETRYHAGQSLAVQRIYDPDGKLVGERVLRNGVIIMESIVH